METLHFTTEINATTTKVWQVLWDDVTYRKWASTFCEGSYAVSNWNEGDGVHFLDSTGNGIYSIIEILQI